MQLPKLIQILLPKKQQTKPKNDQLISSTTGADLWYKASLGRWGEREAVKYLKHLGWSILEQNWHDQLGEGDILAQDENTIVLIEVKTKSNLIYGDPVEMITPAKQRKLRQLAYRLMQRYTTAIRIDVITVLRLPSGRSELKHYPGAIHDKKL